MVYVLEAQALHAGRPQATLAAETMTRQWHSDKACHMHWCIRHPNLEISNGQGQHQMQINSAQIGHVC